MRAMKELITYSLQRLKLIHSQSKNKIKESIMQSLAYGIVKKMASMNAITHILLRCHYSVQINHYVIVCYMLMIEAKFSFSKAKNKKLDCRRLI